MKRLGGSAKLQLVCVALVAATLLSSQAIAAPSRVYLMNDNHTDYGWNDTVAHYESAMLSDLDYYLGRIGATVGNPSDEQARYACDGWFWIWLYQHNRSEAQFQNLVAGIASGHITVPLNPMVTLYGALQTEAAIRSGYYAGKLQRRYGLTFRLAQEMENQTIPWGIASIWAGSGVKYSWKGTCGCATAGTNSGRDAEVFRWQGPDDKSLLMKWYYLNNNASWGGYAEARYNLSSAGIQGSIDHFALQPPYLPITGLFGAGWDDVSWQTSQFESLAQSWNAAHVGGDHVRVSNGIDYFQDLESYAGSLTTQRGGWGNEWDMGPAALGERTAQTRRAIEGLHTAEALAAVVHQFDRSVWPPRQAAIESALVDFHKYYEHSWGATSSSLLTSVIANKKIWAQSIDDAVAGTTSAAAASFAALLTTPAAEDRFVVFNPLGFARTDYADLPIASNGPFVVTDVSTAAEVPSQVVVLGGSSFLRILASDVPSLGYRVYRYQAGSGANFGNAASVTSNVLDNGRYAVTLGTRGQITSVVDKSVVPNRELVSASTFNDFGSGSSSGLTVENAGPVSVSLRRDVGGTPARRVRVTLTRNSDRVDVEDEIFANYTPLAQYRFDVNLSNPQIRFEEVGAVMRPGFLPAGDFLPGARTDYVTLNHFASFASSNGSPYTITLSNADSFLMQVGNSTASAFSLPTQTVRVVASASQPFQGGGWYGSDISDQGGEAYLLTRFAVQGGAGAYSGAAAMRLGLAHQNPLQAMALARNQSGPLSDTNRSFLSVNAANIVVTAFKPAEEADRGWVVRLWELDGAPTDFSIDASAFAPTTATEVSLIETDAVASSLAGGVIAASIGANEIKAYRFGGAPPGPTATRTQTLTPTQVPSPTPTPLPSRTPNGPSYTPTQTLTPTASPTPSATLSANAAPVVGFCFDEGSGSTTFDDSGNGHVGTLINQPTWTAGRFGQGLRFDGNASGHQYVSFGADDFLDGLSQGTVMAWVLPSPGNTRCWFQSGENGACQWPFELCLSSTDQFQFWGGAADCGTTLEAASTLPSPATAWHHLAYVVDGGGNRFYVDGQPAEPTYAKGGSTSQVFFAQTATGTSKYRIGATETAAETFNGVIDEFRIYSVPLSQAQIQAAMSNSLCAPDCFEVPNDNCPCVSNPLQVDADGDGIGDACDLCTTATTGQTAWILPRLTLSAINDGIAANDRLTFTGRFTLATGSFDIDPLANGAQVEIRAADGRRKAYVALPGGAYVRPGPGWVRSRTGRQFLFRDQRPGGSNGISYLSVNDKLAGAVKITLRAARASFDVSPSDGSLAATLVFGGAAAAANGQCGELRFAGGQCLWNRAQTRVACKQ